MNTLHCSGVSTGMPTQLACVPGHWTESIVSLAVAALGSQRRIFAMI